MQGSSIRPIVVTGTILFTIVTGALVGANASGTTQQALDEACENAVWPMIQLLASLENRPAILIEQRYLQRRDN